MLYELALIRFASQLDLGWHQQDVLFLGIDHRKQHGHFLAAIDDLSNPRTDLVSSLALTLRMLTVKGGQGRCHLALEEFVEIALLDGGHGLRRRSKDLLQKGFDRSRGRSLRRTFLGFRVRGMGDRYRDGLWDHHRTGRWLD